MRPTRLGWGVILAATIIVACLFATAAKAQTPSWATTDPVVERYNLSVYADRYIGRKMADGRRYNPAANTVAANDYPLGTRLTIRYKGRTAKAIVTDRLSRRWGVTRIDLSHSLYRRLSGGKPAGVLVGAEVSEQ